MLRKEGIYDYVSLTYEKLVSREDYFGNIPAALQQIADFQGKDVVDLGAGTGRLTSLAAQQCSSIVAVDQAEDMLKVAADKLSRSQVEQWKTVVADVRRLPLEDDSADIVMAGWSLCYVGSSGNPAWASDLRQVMQEIRRVLRPGGTVIIMETLGTGNEEPDPPSFLVDYFRELEQQYGFRHQAIRTDYRFDSVAEASQLCRYFFGDELGDWIQEKQTNIVPECTGVWWRVG